MVATLPWLHHGPRRRTSRCPPSRRSPRRTLRRSRRPGRRHTAFHCPFTDLSPSSHRRPMPFTTILPPFLQASASSRVTTWIATVRSLSLPPPRVLRTCRVAECHSSSSLLEPTRIGRRFLAPRCRGSWRRSSRPEWCCASWPTSSGLAAARRSRSPRCPSRSGCGTRLSSTFHCLSPRFLAFSLPFRQRVHRQCCGTLPPLIPSLSACPASAPATLLPLHAGCLLAARGCAYSGAGGSARC